MTYVDGFVIPIPVKNLPAYKKMARLGSKVWLEHGALEYFECRGDDLNVPIGIPFPRLAKPRRGETVVFSWIVYKSRASRDRVNAKVMNDPRLLRMMKSKPMPFDLERMTFGGFKVLVKA